MTRHLTIEDHLQPQQLEDRYRKAKDPVERTHLHIVWLLASGKPSREVAELTGYSVGWVRTIARRYNAFGPEGLGDRRHRNPGARPLLSEEQRAQLWEALQGEPPEGGLWNSCKVAKWIEAKTGRKVYVQRGWEYLKALGFSLQRPRPRHAGADAREQEAFKKGSHRG